MPANSLPGRASVSALGPRNSYQPSLGVAKAGRAGTFSPCHRRSSSDVRRSVHSCVSGESPNCSRSLRTAFRHRKRLRAGRPRSLAHCPTNRQEISGRAEQVRLPVPQALAGVLAAGIVFFGIDAWRHRAPFCPVRHADEFPARRRSIRRRPTHGRLARCGNCSTA